MVGPHGSSVGGAMITVMREKPLQPRLVLQSRNVCPSMTVITSSMSVTPPWEPRFAFRFLPFVKIKDYEELPK